MSVEITLVRNVNSVPLFNIDDQRHKNSGQMFSAQWVLVTGVRRVYLALAVNHGLILGPLTG